MRWRFARETRRILASFVVRDWPIVSTGRGQEVTMRKILMAALFGIAVGVGSAQAAEVVVTVRPPRAVVEHRVVAPSRNHVWVPGYHVWDGRAYVWTPGHWEVPPRPHAKWVAPRWNHRRDGWVFVEGRWR